MNLKFGDKVLVSDKGRRVYRSVPDKMGVEKAFWKFHDIEPTVGIFLGYRTLNDGVVEWVYEVGHVFTPKEPMKVALVAIDSNTNPFYTQLKESIRPLPELTEKDLDCLRHAVGMTPTRRKAQWGFRNRYTTTYHADSYQSILKLEDWGYMVEVDCINDMMLFKATRAGCKAIGLHRNAIKRVFSND